ncbi:MAG: RnfABCDGE type electron transport complex subunit D [Firmicutes bacterium]|nr:RnfABCDGE type electron transport complex subunit D [Bacillota bacterium]
MPATEYVVSPAPHLRAPTDVTRLMTAVLLALLPAAVAAVYFFGWRALAVMVVSVVTAVLVEFLCVKAAGRKFVMDGSAVITGLLLAMVIPPDVPLWMPVIGSGFAIAVGKQIFGGLGYNPLNPALLGRALLLVSWPTIMTTWRWPNGALAWAGEKAAAVATATPLYLAKSGTLARLGLEIPYWQLFWGNRAGSLGETSVLALLLGGLFLIAMKVIDWRIPLSYLGSVVVLALVFGENPLFNLLTGGLMLGAFFMATDYVTSPLTKRGRAIFGLGCGLLTMLIRRYGGYPEGVCYAILIMNATVPLLERATLPRRFGEVKARA